MPNAIFAALVILIAAVGATLAEPTQCTATSPRGPRIGGAILMWGCP